MKEGGTVTSARSKWVYLLLAIPLLGTAWVPLYNSLGPTWFGFPFFYWYQLAWVPGSVLVTGMVYWLTEPRRAGARSEP